jgi:hypothetical protein
MGLGTAYGQCSDPFDAVLCVYKLDAAQAQQFSTTDGQISAFWSDWATKDYVELLPPDDCYPGSCNFTDETDGALTLKLAATVKGLYVYAAVQDNVWVDPSTPDACCDDSVDLYFDAMSADAIWNCTDCLVGLYDSKLTFTTQQFQVFMGANSVPTTFRLAFYDDALWSWTTQEQLTFTTAKSTYGIDIEVVEVDATHKTQEWFIPWTTFGKGLQVGTALANQTYAFAGGWNDVDGDSPTSDKLRWPNGKDPWMGDDNYWGDMLLPADMGAVEAMPVAQPRRVAAARSAGPVQSEYYSLKGERLRTSAVRTGTVAGMAVRRTMGADGSDVSSVVRPDW